MEEAEPRPRLLGAEELPHTMVMEAEASGWTPPSAYCASPLSSSDSGLEAFSRDPTRGSLAALRLPSTACTDDVP